MKKQCDNKWGGRDDKLPCPARSPPSFKHRLTLGHERTVKQLTCTNSSRLPRMICPLREASQWLLNYIPKDSHILTTRMAAWVTVAAWRRKGSEIGRLNESALVVLRTLTKNGEESWTGKGVNHNMICCFRSLISSPNLQGLPTSGTLKLKGFWDKMLTFHFPNGEVITRWTTYIGLWHWPLSPNSNV